MSASFIITPINLSTMIHNEESYPNIKVGQPCFV